MKVKDITGQRFGRLVAIERVMRQNDKLSYWVCQCDCGNKPIIYLGNLSRDNTRSCGCLHKEQTAKNMRATNLKRRRFKNTPLLSSKYSYYLRNAKSRKIIWEITPEQFEEIVKQNCYYCASSERIGVDRVDISKPYQMSNAVPCCTACNQAKNDRSVSEFAAWVERIYAHLQAEKWSR